MVGQKSPINWSLRHQWADNFRVATSYFGPMGCQGKIRLIRFQKIISQWIIKNVKRFLALQNTGLVLTNVRK